MNIFVIEEEKRLNRKLSIRVFAMLLVISIVMSSLNIEALKAKISQPLPVSYMDENFPDSYKIYIDNLKAKHPNWTFKAVHLNLDWNTALSHETYEVSDGISTVEDSFGSEWKKDGENNYQDGNYVTASKAGVAYVMDPRNFLTDEGVFQFEVLDFNEVCQPLNAVEASLASTLMGSTRKKQYMYYGSWYDLDKTYAQLIYDYSKEVGINPVHIASRIKQENGGRIDTNKMINGSSGLYNYFNIVAYDSSGASALTNGLNYARKNGWTSPNTALKGGIKYIHDKYVKWGQDTIYFERFDVNNPGQGQYLLGTGYMTNIFAPRSESKITYNAYKSYNMLDLPFEFHIPVYDNMPSNPCQMPVPNEVYFEEDNTKVYLDDPSDSGVNDTFWIRSAPDTSSSYDVLVETKEGQENRTHFTRTGIGHNTLFDRIQYEDGKIGYILKKWVYEVKYTKVSDISLNITYTDLTVGDKLNLVANISPENADNKSINWSSSDSNIASVDENGVVTANNVGVATITAVTVDQGKSAICTVNVESNKVTGISLPNSSYDVTIGSSTIITPSFTPSTAKNTNYSIVSSDPSVATVNGVVINAISKGTTTLTFISEDGGYSVKATLNVLSNEDEKIDFDKSFRVENKQISNINPNENSVKNIKEKINSNYDIELLDISGKTLGNDDLVGTGTVIRFLKNSEIKDEYTIILYGDVDGSGVINARDLLMLQRYILGKTSLNQVQVKAGIIDKQSQAPNASDLLKIQRHILGKYKIEQ